MSWEWDVVIPAPQVAVMPCSRIVQLCDRSPNDDLDSHEFDSHSIYLFPNLVRGTIRFICFSYPLLKEYLLRVCMNWLTIWTIVPQKFGGAGGCDNRLKIPRTKQQKTLGYSYTVLELSEVFFAKYSVGSGIDLFCRIASIVLLFLAIKLLTWAWKRYNVGLDSLFEHMTLNVPVEYENDVIALDENQCSDCFRTSSEWHCDEPQPQPQQFLRGDKPLNKQSLTNQLHSKSFLSVDSGRSYNETTVGSSGYGSSVNSNYSQNTFKSQIVGLQHSNLSGIDSVPDKATDSVQLNKLQNALDNTATRHSYREPCVSLGHHNQRITNNWDPPANVRKKEETVREPVTKSGYSKPTYAVLIGNTVTVYDTSRFASLPNYSKFMVKERQRDSFGVTRVKLALKYCEVKEEKR